MAITWPASLPNYVLIEGYVEVPPKNVIRSSMSVGPPKTRQRSTAATRPITINQILRKTQLATFDEFYTTTLSSGTDSFDWTHPRTSAAMTCKFTEEPTYESLGGTSWKVTMKLEILP